MHLELEKCEKALTEYLDMKKNVFPRYDFAKASSEVQKQSDVVRALPYRAVCLTLVSLT